MESEIKQKRDGDSPVVRNPQRDGQEGAEASTIKRLHLESKKLSGAAGQDYFERRRRLLVKLILI